jgi:cytochrome c553
MTLFIRRVALLACCFIFVSCVSAPEDGENDGPSWLIALWEGDHFPDLGDVDTSNLNDTALVKKRFQRGRYLVESVAACGICHGESPENPATVLSGGRKIRSEDGFVFASNITPDARTGIGKWSITQIVDGLRSSKRPDGTRLARGVHRQYSWISDSDARAVGLYLLSKEPVFKEVERSDPGFLSNREWSVFSSNKSTRGYVPEYKTSATAQYGRYLSHNVAGCKSCHSPNSPESEELFSGSSSGRGGLVRSLKKLGSSIVSISETSKDEQEAVNTVVSPEGKKIIETRKMEKDDSMVAKLGRDLRESLEPESIESNFPVGGPDIRGKSSGVSIETFLADGSLPDGRKVNPRLCPWTYYKNMKPVDKQAISYYLKRL